MDVIYCLAKSGDSTNAFMWNLFKKYLILYALITSEA